MPIRGFTLLELLCVLGISTILLALGLPALHQHLASTAVKTATSQTLAGLALARRTALASGQPVTLCLTSDLTHCNLGGTEWMIFLNQTGGSPAVREAGESILQQWPMQSGVAVTGTRSHAWYLPQPRAASTLTWNFCHPAAAAAQRSIVISQTGRPRLTGRDHPNSPPPSHCPKYPAPPTD